MSQTRHGRPVSESHSFRLEDVISTVVLIGRAGSALECGVYEQQAAVRAMTAP